MQCGSQVGIRIPPVVLPFNLDPQEMYSGRLARPAIFLIALENFGGSRKNEKNAEWQLEVQKRLVTRLIKFRQLIRIECI